MSITGNEERAQGRLIRTQTCHTTVTTNSMLAYKCFLLQCLGLKTRPCMCLASAQAMICAQALYRVCVCVCV